MNDLKSLVVPVLMIAGWFGLAVGTLVKLGDMGGTLAAIESAEQEQARQASIHAARVASVTPRSAAE
jgi:hypothetical protein